MSSFLVASNVISQIRSYKEKRCILAHGSEDSKGYGRLASKVLRQYRASQCPCVHAHTHMYKCISSGRYLFPIKQPGFHHGASTPFDSNHLPEAFL